MIEIKKINLALNLNKTTIVLDDNQLNNTIVGGISWNNQPILFITLQNNANVDFNTFTVLDSIGRDLTHNSQVHKNCYSIAFSGTSSGQPLQLTELTSLNTISFNFGFAGVAVGNLIINLYTFAL